MYEYSSDMFYTSVCVVLRFISIVGTCVKSIARLHYIYIFIFTSHLYFIASLCSVLVLCVPVEQAFSIV